MVIIKNVTLLCQCAPCTILLCIELSYYVLNVSHCSGIKDVLLFWNKCVSKGIKGVPYNPNSIRIIIPYKIINECHQVYSRTFYCGLKDKHDCWCNRTKRIPFLDTTVHWTWKNYNRSLQKPTDRCMYLLPSSCHPTQISNSIPFSLVGRARSNFF